MRHRRRQIIPQHLQDYSEEPEYADRVGGSLALQPGPAERPVPVRPGRAGSGNVPVAKPSPPGVSRARRWVNPYRSVVVPFSVGLVSDIMLPANPRRVYVLVQNLNAASDMWLNFGAEAVVQASVLLVPRGNYELIGGATGAPFSPYDSVHVIGTVAAQRCVAVEGIWRFDV